MWLSLSLSLFLVLGFGLVLGLGTSLCLCLSFGFGLVLGVGLVFDMILLAADAESRSWSGFRYFSVFGRGRLGSRPWCRSWGVSLSWSRFVSGCQSEVGVLG